MRISELSKRTGVSIRMLRYYEQEQLLKPVRRQSGYRDYVELDELKVLRIRLLTSSGMTLTTIRQMLPCLRSSNLPEFERCDGVRAILRREVQAVESKIQALRECQDVLETFLQQVDH